MAEKTGVETKVRVEPRVSVPRKASGWRIFNQIVLIFAIGCVFGTYYEEVITLWKNFWESGGELIWQSRRGLIYGPLSPVYGIGAVAIYGLFYKTKLNTTTCLLGGAVFGGMLEIMLSVAQEMWFGTRSWDYSGRPLSICHGRTTLIYMMFWGLLVMLVARWMLPFLDKLYDRLEGPMMNKICVVMAVFLVFDIMISAAAATRQTMRRAGDSADNAVEVFLDRHFSDERLKKVYDNAEYIRN